MTKSPLPPRSDVASSRHKSDGDVASSHQNQRSRSASFVSPTSPATPKPPSFIVEAASRLKDGFFLILEAEADRLSQEQKSLLEQIKTDPKFSLDFLSASSCRRHVYFFRNAQVAADSTIPALQELAGHSITDSPNLRIYFAKDVLKFLLLWVSGSLNEGKYCNDTYNRKTVNTCVELFEKFLAIRDEVKSLTLGSAPETKHKDLGKAFGKKFTLLQNSIDKEIQALRATQPTPSNLEEKVKWQTTKKEEASRMKEFGFLRSIESSSAHEFDEQLKNIFVVVNTLCTFLEQTKQLNGLKQLWSGVIKKENLDALKEANTELFKEIIRCRKEFLSSTADDLLQTLDNSLTVEEVRQKAFEKFSKRISELSVAAKKTLEGRDKSPSELLEERFDPSGVVSVEEDKLSNQTSPAEVMKILPSKSQSMSI